MFWTKANEASVVFHLNQVPQKPLRLSLHLRYTNYPPQKVIVLLNNNQIETFNLENSLPVVIQISLPKTALNFEGVNILTFSLPDAISPQALGQSKDDRQLGIGLQELILKQ